MSSIGPMLTLCLSSFVWNFIPPYVASVHFFLHCHFFWHLKNMKPRPFNKKTWVVQSWHFTAQLCQNKRVLFPMDLNCQVWEQASPAKSPGWRLGRKDPQMSSWKLFGRWKQEKLWIYTSWKHDDLLLIFLDDDICEESLSESWFVAIVWMWLQWFGSQLSPKESLVSEFEPKQIWEALSDLE